MDVLLEKISIKNYRSCQDLHFDLRKGLSVVIGPNGSGKTNILMAILLLKKLCHERSPSWLDTTDIVPSEISLTAIFRVDGKRVSLNAEIGTYTDEHNTDVITSSEVSWNMRSITKSQRKIKAPFDAVEEMRGHGGKFEGYRRQFYMHHFNLGEEEMNVISEIQGFLKEMKYYSASQFTNPSQCPVSFEIEEDGKRKRGYRLTGHSKLLYDIYAESKKKPNSSYNEFIEMMGSNGVGLVEKIEFKEIPTSSVDYKVRSGGRVRQRNIERSLIIPQFYIGNNVLSPNQLSEGTFKTIALLFYVMTESSSMLFIEEPEVCVHHGLLSSIVELIKTYANGKQLVISTHSDLLLDHVDPYDVFCVKKHPVKGTKIDAISVGLSKSDFASLKNYLKEDGNLGEYWREGGIE